MSSYVRVDQSELRRLHAVDLAAGPLITYVTQFVEVIEQHFKFLVTVVPFTKMKIACELLRDAQVRK